MILLKPYRLPTRSVIVRLGATFSFMTLGLAFSLLASFSVLRAQTAVGIYFPFQTTGNAGTYNASPAVSTFPGAASFSRSGSELFEFDNFGQSFTAFDGSVWVPGKSTSWNNGSTSNSWQVTMNTTGVSNMSARFKYRLNSLESGGGLANGFSAFEYQLGAGAFQPVPGTSLTLINDQSYNNEWAVDLTALSAINDQSSVTLRWTLPDFDAGSSTQLRVDDLQITGTDNTPPTPPDPRTRYLPVGNYNVLFISFDDLKANFGKFITPELAAKMPKPVTPNLDRLAASGMSFTRAYCQQPVCWTSRTSLLTGTRPDTTKNWDDGIKFRDTMPGIITLPQHFANKGYSSAAYGKIYDFRSANSNQDQPLSWPDGQSSPGVSNTNGGDAHHFFENGHWQAEQAAATGSSARRALFATDAGETNFWVTPNRPVNGNTDYQDGLIASAGISKLNIFAADYTNTATPFFLAVGFVRPHLPFTAPKTYWDLYDPDQINLEGYDGTLTMPNGTLPFTAATYELGSYQDMMANPVSPTDARRLIHGYLAATSFADAQLGRVLDALEATGTANNTIIVMFGDHGWHLGDHNGFWAKHSCYEQAARSPLIISAPGMAALGTAGATCSSPVEFVDIYPTLVDLASLNAPAQPAGMAFEGTSLRSLLEDPLQPWKKGAFTQYQRNISGTGLNAGDGMGYSIRTSRYRYTEWWRTQSTKNASGDSLDRDVKLFSTPEHVELYDMQEDPGETVNLAQNAAYASLVTELANALAGGYGWDTEAVAIPADYPDSWADWQSASVEPGYPIADFAQSLDPDGDSIPNILEYVMGTHPLYPDANPVTSKIADIGGNPYLTLEYPHVVSRSDVDFFAESSANLTSWLTTGVTLDNLGANANYSLLRAAVPISGPAPSAVFLRLSAENP